MAPVCSCVAAPRSAGRRQWHICHLQLMSFSLTLNIFTLSWQRQRGKQVNILPGLGACGGQTTGSAKPCHPPPNRASIATSDYWPRTPSRKLHGTIYISGKRVAHTNLSALCKATSSWIRKRSSVFFFVFF